MFIFPKYIHGEKLERAFIPHIGIEKRKTALEGVARTTNTLDVWHSSVLFGLASKSVENARKFEDGRCNPKVSVFAVNRRFGVFEEKKVQKTGVEGEKRNWT